MPRKNDWQRLLFKEIERHDRRPFKYGSSDCWTLANRAARAMTGKSLIPGVKYSSAAGALRELKRHGSDDVAGAMKVAGLEAVHPAMAQRGDIGVTKGKGGEPALVICVGAQWVGKTETGLMHVPLTSIVKAYRVS